MRVKKIGIRICNSNSNSCFVVYGNDIYECSDNNFTKDKKCYCDSC